jgi:hypothetical protein
MTHAAEDFLVLCRKALAVSGVGTYAGDDAWLRTHVWIRTPEGEVLIEEIGTGWRVIGPGQAVRFEYIRPVVRDSGTTPGHIRYWNGPKILELIPLIEKKLVLDLLADV